MSTPSIEAQPTIETELLTLRPYVDSDAARVLDILSRLDVIRWLGDPPYIPMETLDEALAWIARWAGVHTLDPRLGAWALVVKETGIIAGTALLVQLPHGDGKVQIGWHLHPDSMGQGFATEAARAMLGTGFANGLSEIWVDMFVDNGRSAAVARRLGLREVGVGPDPWYGGDSLLFHLTSEDWTTR